MVGITYAYIDTVFGFYGYFFFTHLYCLVECCCCFVFLIHNLSLVCMVGITYAYIDTVAGFYGYFF